jgi:putative membrane protein
MGGQLDEAVASPLAPSERAPAADARRATWLRVLASVGTIAGALVGAGLAALLLEHFGLRTVISLLSRAGYGILAVIAFHATQLWLTAAAWRSVLPVWDRPPEHRPGMGILFVIRWIREGLNTLLPTAQIGGIVVGIGLLGRRGIAPNDATAATVADLSIEMSTQIVFTLLGVALLLATIDGRPLVLPLLIGFCVVSVMALVLVGIQRSGFVRFAERLARRLGRPGRVQGLHEALLRIYRNRRAVLRAAACHLSSWLMGGVEVCLAMHFLGHDVGIKSGVIVESLGQMLRVASFAIPGALGVQEGGYILLCGLLGLGPDLALALSLVKRLREVVLGAPSIGVWLWLRRHRAVAVPRSS